MHNPGGSTREGSIPSPGTTSFHPDTHVWEIIERHLSELKEKTARILDSLK